MLVEFRYRLGCAKQSRSNAKTAVPLWGGGLAFPARCQAACRRLVAGFRNICAADLMGSSACLLDAETLFLARIFPEAEFDTVGDRRFFLPVFPGGRPGFAAVGLVCSSGRYGALAGHDLGRRASGCGAGPQNPPIVPVEFFLAGRSLGFRLAPLTEFQAVFDRGFLLPATNRR